MDDNLNTQITVTNTEITKVVTFLSTFLADSIQANFQNALVNLDGIREIARVLSEAQILINTLSATHSDQIVARKPSDAFVTETVTRPLNIPVLDFRAAAQALGNASNADLENEK